MTETERGIASVAPRLRRISADASIVEARFLGGTAVFVLGENDLLFATKEGDASRLPVHAGAILSAAADARRLVTGGDDGKIVATDASGKGELVALDAKRRWIDRVALAPNGAVAWSAGKQAFVLDRNGSKEVLELPSTIGGLTFLPKGFRLAVAHYNGATLWFPKVKAGPEQLPWKGSHLAITVSRDGHFLVTAMQEPALHGWRLADRKDMRMQGYAARVRSLDWSADGKWLTSSGAHKLVLWPFDPKDGPMGKTPQLFAPAESAVTSVACHPAQAVVAAGYADELVLLVRLDDGAEILARERSETQITALAWSADGKLLAIGTDEGEAGILDLS